MNGVGNIEMENAGNLSNTSMLGSEKWGAGNGQQTENVLIALMMIFITITMIVVTYQLMMGLI